MLAANIVGKYLKERLLNSWSEKSEKNDFVWLLKVTSKKERVKFELIISGTLMFPRRSFQQSFLYHFTVVMLFQNWTEIWSKGNLILFNTADGEQNKAPPCEHMKNQCVEIISCNITNLKERDCPNYFLLTWLFNVSVTETVWTFFFVFPSQASLQ